MTNHEIIVKAAEEMVKAGKIAKAEDLKTYEQWQRAGRNVKKGMKAAVKIELWVSSGRGFYKSKTALFTLDQTAEIESRKPEESKPETEEVKAETAETESAKVESQPEVKPEEVKPETIREEMPIPRGQIKAYRACMKNGKKQALGFYGYPVKIERESVKMDAAVTKLTDQWTVIELTTGLSVGVGKTKAAALKNAEETIDRCQHNAEWWENTLKTGAEKLAEMPHNDEEIMIEKAA